MNSKNNLETSSASVEHVVHTPGPWKINYRRVTPVNGKQDGTDDICHVYGDEDKEIANARLIAAAPEMLEALQMFTSYYPMGINPDLDDAYRKASKVLKKVV